MQIHPVFHRVRVSLTLVFCVPLLLTLLTNSQSVFRSLRRSHLLRFRTIRPSTWLNQLLVTSHALLRATHRPRATPSNGSTTHLGRTPLSQPKSSTEMFLTLYIGTGLSVLLPCVLVAGDSFCHPLLHEDSLILFGGGESAAELHALVG